MFDRDEQFIEAWVKNVPDTNMRIYLKFEMHPDKLPSSFKNYSCPQDVYNLWEPFAYSLKTGDYTRDQEGLSKILHLVRVLANNDDAVEKFLLDWMAQMVQYPQTKSVMPVIKSEVGAGKGSVIKILSVLLGKNKVWDCTDPLRDIFGTFNDKMRDAFLLSINETSAKDFASVMGKVKQAVTDETFTLRAMQTGAIILPSFHRFIVTTNEDFPMPTTRGDRRAGIIQASNELCGNDEFFAELNDVIKSETSMRTFWDYLMERPVKEVMTRKDLPLTTYQQELQRLDEHPVVQWLQYLATEVRSRYVRMNPDGMWQSYVQFCERDNIKTDRVNKRSFETKLGFTLNSIPDASEKVQSTSGRERRINVEILRKFYKIELSEKKPEIDYDDPE